MSEPTTKPTTRVEYVVRCNARRESSAYPDALHARNAARVFDDKAANDCETPHRVIKRTITEEDVTDE